MDFRNVKGLTIPAGEVKKILIGDLVIWSKKTENKYKILKNGEQVANVTMSQLVKAVQTGAAQEDWDIGAQIIVPYHDSWDDNDYELPFNFGTFTAYGEGKLGVQAHYAIPSEKLRFTEARGNIANYTNSMIKKWLNAYKTEHNITSLDIYKDKIGFLGCLPEDFVETMKVTYVTSFYDHQKVFLLGLEELCCSTTAYPAPSSYPIKAPTALTNVSVWEYWKNKIGEPQTLHTANENRMFYAIDNLNQPSGDYIITPIPCHTKASYSASWVNPNCNYGFNGEGNFIASQSPNDSYRYFPACIIG